jgi:hypothetical protein
MIRKRLLLFVVAFTFILQSPLRAAELPKEELVERVRKAIDSGVRFLSEKEKGKGNWEVGETSVSNPGGLSCLAVLALLNAGVPPNDPLIQRGIAYIRTVPPSRTYVVSLQTMVFAELQARSTGKAERNEDADRIQRNVDWLLKAMIRRGNGIGGWSYFAEGRTGDNSNTQYALLGLHAGHLAGAKIDRTVWEAIRQYYLDEQHEGGWVYSSQHGGQPILTMTTAGVCGLLISGLELNQGREEIDAKGVVTGCGVYTEDRKLAQGLAWISRKFVPRRAEGGWNDFDHNNYYSLYGIERAGRLSGQRFFGDYDWYRIGCQYLLEKQRNGYWEENQGGDSVAVISTSFALLFLSKGRTPILISKFAFGDGNDWNNDRNDARHLVEYASKEVFHKLPLGWQIFDTRGQDLSTPDKITDQVHDLLQAPIVYITGHQKPDIRDAQRTLLKEYVEQGGFIFAEACCGRKEFADGFRELMKDLFPDSPLRPLPADHPIYRAHAVLPAGAFDLEGIEYGCKTVVIFSPQDVSCQWESNHWTTDSGQLAFRLGGNLIAYATGMEPPKEKLTPTEVVQDDPEGKRIPRGYLTVAQLRRRDNSDWQPAPNAIRNLMSHLRKNSQLDVVLRPKGVFTDDKDLADFKFLYMHGRGRFSLTEAEITNLRNDLETGGLLFADACCGKKAFDESFRDMISRLYPDRKLEPISLTDDLYGKDVNNGSEIRTVRCRTAPGELRNLPPALEGIKVQNRWVIIYSKYDIGCALEKHNSPDCLGHDHASALLLGGAVVSYALKR